MFYFKVLVDAVEKEDEFEKELRAKRCTNRVVLISLCAWDRPM